MQTPQPVGWAERGQEAQHMLGARGTHIIDSMAVRPHLRQDVIPIPRVRLAYRYTARSGVQGGKQDGLEPR